MKLKTIGILGGMGPEATAQLYLRIIQIFQQRYGAKYDADFPKIFICNLPLPDVVEAADTKNQVRDCLIQAVGELAAVSVDFIAIPCNTVSYFIDEVRAAVSIPVLSLPEEVAKVVWQRGLQTVGLLATEMTVRTGIYSTALGKVNVIVPLENEVAALTRLIMNILSGKKLAADCALLRGMIEKLKSRGAQVVILGCTELPLLIREEVGLIDTIELLAEAVVKRTIDI